MITQHTGWFNPKQCVFAVWCFFYFLYFCCRFRKWSWR